MGSQALQKIISWIRPRKVELGFLLAVFLAGFGVYFWTAPRRIFFGDNAEFITAVKVLGIPHPSGYPLYVMLAKLFSFLPFGGLVSRVNLFSAFFSSLSLILAFLIGKKAAEIGGGIRREGRIIRYLALAGGVMLLAFSNIFWYQSIAAKTYPLNLFFSLLLLYLALEYRQRPSNRIFYLTFFLCGLSLANHQMILLFLPFVIFELFRPLKNFFQRENLKNALKKTVVGIIFFTLGLSFYLYLPLRSWSRPALDWGGTGRSLAHFACHVSRCSYNDYGTYFSFSDKIKFLLSFGADTYLQFGPILAFSLFGLLFLWKNYRRVLYLFAGLIFSNSIGIIFIRSIAFSEEGRQFYSPYYLPAYSIFALLTALGIIFFFRLRFVAGKKIPCFIFLTLIFTSVIGSLYIGRERNNFRQYRFLDDYSRELLNSLAPNAVLAVLFDNPAEDSVSFALLYQKAVNGIRPDVTIVDNIDIFKQTEPDKVNNIYSIEDKALRRLSLVAYINEKYRGRPLYATFLYSSDKYDSLSNGLAYQIFPLGSPVKKELGYSVPVLPQDEIVMRNDYFGREVLANYFLSQAAARLTDSKEKEAQNYFIKSIKLNNNPFGIDQYSYINYRGKLTVPHGALLP